MEPTLTRRRIERRTFWAVFALQVVATTFVCFGAAEAALSPPTDDEIEAGSPQDTYGVSFIFLWFFALPLLIVSLAGNAFLVRAGANLLQRRLIALQTILIVLAFGVLLLAHSQLKDRVLT